MTVDLQTCLNLSDAVYGGQIKEMKIPAGWTQIDVPGSNDKYYRNPITGFAGAAYGLDANQDGVYEQIVVAYRGTERNGLGEKGGDNVPLTPDALAFYESIKNANPNSTITITGHSLGGALAQMVAARALQEFNITVFLFLFVEAINQAFAKIVIEFLLIY